MREQFAYDQAKSEEENNYCKKCKYESKWCKHRKEREVAKQKLGAAITTYERFQFDLSLVLSSMDGENPMIT